MSRRTDLTKHAAAVGLYVADYNPGGTKIRYKFDRKEDNYFAMRGIYTAIGIAEAETFLAGYAQAYDHLREQNT